MNHIDLVIDAIESGSANVRNQGQAMIQDLRKAMGVINY